MNDAGENLRYFTRQQCAAQWQAFLAAFASELGQQIPANELRILMGRFGKFMAQSLPMPSGTTLDDLEASINTIWFNINWGWVKLNEKDDGLYIEHHAAPLQAAFGAEALEWSPAILEAIYAHWLSTISASSSLQLTQAEPAKADSMLLVYRYGRNP